MTVGVISAQKKMLRLLTAWEENIPMMEKATEKFLFSEPEVSDGEAGKAQGHKDNCSFSRIVCTQYRTWILFYVQDQTRKGLEIEETECILIL